MPSIRTSAEPARGCGYRQPGGTYLVSDRLTEPCNKLPIEMTVCPCCGAGIRASRAWTWITPDPLLDPGPHGSEWHDTICPLGTAIDWVGERAGLIWIGEKFYKTPAEFMVEAAMMGVSRRVNGVPRGFEVGKHWVALGHPKAVTHPEIPEDEKGHKTPGIFTFFKPTAAEYIVKGDETEGELEHKEKLGYSLVKVIKLEKKVV